MRGLGTIGCEVGCGCEGGTFSCSPCALPLENLTISWVNSIANSGSAVYTWNGNSVTPVWATSSILYPSGFLGSSAMGCSGGNLSMFAGIDLSHPTCGYPTGPGTLLLGSFTCGSGFTLVFTVNATNCPGLFSLGFTSFTITL